MNDETITASPLCWPAGWKREKNPTSSRFGRYDKKMTIHRACDFVIDELRKMGFADSQIIISTDLKLRNDGLPYSNQRTPDDKGASVWWRDGLAHKVIAIDKWDSIADNIYAIGKTIEALRGIERWGSGEVQERSFTGFQALPDQNSDTWWIVLGVNESDDYDTVKLVYLKLRSLYHTDTPGGDRDKYDKVMAAWEAFKEIML